jgi:hypothetical protein
MYKIEIDISAWGGDEKVTIETNDFDKVQVIQEFIDLQMANGWAVEYDVVIDEDEDEEDEPSTVSTYVVTKIED